MVPRLSRRQFLAGAGGAVVAGAGLNSSPARAGARAAGLETAGGTFKDPVADLYNELLLRHTNWVEQQWDATAGYFTLTNDSFAVVLGNAVLLTHGEYDEATAGVSAATLHDQTVATITHFAASNVLAGGSEWGETMFFESTFELYFTLAAKLLWDDLDAATQANVAAIMTGQAAYTTALGSGNDPRSPGWTPNGLAGGWQGDTKIDEMAVYAQCLGPALAWYPGDSDAVTWRHWLDLWLLNDTGLPPADRANPSVADGEPISANTAHNIYDTFIVENHGSFEPHYQMETWRMSARVAAHFMAAGQPVPASVTRKPNGRQLWATMRRVMSDSGEPFMPMINDRYHLFGRDVIPLAFLAQVLGDRHAARAEANLAAELIPYQQYPPQYQLTKFSGQASYEPEARAELGISYLFHRWRAASGAAPVVPVSDKEFFGAAAGATDYGPGPGLLAHCSTTAFAATVTKPGFVKCVFVPNHDDWLFDVSSSTPFLLPSAGATVVNRSAVAYNALRDGFDGTAALLTLSAGFAGYASLPTGTAVYATSGNGPAEGSISVFNLDMPGVAGLDGQRTYTGADGAVTIQAAQAPGPGTAAFTFPAVAARYVRMQGVMPATQYGYSIFELSVSGPGSTTDLAVGKTATASSFDDGTNPVHPSPGYPPRFATDGDPTTRWAVSVPQRGNPASWLQVDLGAPVQVTGVTLIWEAAYGAGYEIQVSLDAATWTSVVTVPELHTFQGNWLNVEGRAGFVVTGSTNPVTASASKVTLSDGPASGSAGMVIEAYAAQPPASTQAAAARSRPSGAPPGLAVSSADDYLSLFNLTGADVGPAGVTIPQRPRILLYRGSQATDADGTVYQAWLPAATARVEPPRFALTPGPPGSTADQPALPAGLQVTVTDSCQVSVTAPAGYPATRATVTSLATGEARPVTVRTGATVELTFHGRLTPSPDLALGRTTYPTSPLPDTMSDPGFAVDGDPATAWLPGPGGRMVVDLGSELALGRLELRWTPGRVPPAEVSVSADGLSYTAVGSTPGGPRQQAIPLGSSARYVAVAVPAWAAGCGKVAELSAFAPD
jgi:F5/8 type C domain-containing protein